MANFFSKGSENSKELTEIFEMFIKPYVEYHLDRDSKKEESRGIKELIGDFFHEDTRDIYWGKAIEDFTMPGALIISSNQAIRGLKTAPILKGAPMLISTDSTQNFVVIETLSGSRTFEFKLNRAEYRLVKNKIKFRK